MTNFRSRLHILLREAMHRGGHGSVPTIEECERFSNSLLVLVKEAIDTPQVSPEIDTMLVRSMMGKSGTRSAHIGAVQHGERRVGYLTPELEIFCRVYATERQCNAFPHEATARAIQAVARFPKVHTLNVRGQ